VYVVYNNTLVVERDRGREATWWTSAGQTEADRLPVGRVQSLPNY